MRPTSCAGFALLLLASSWAAQPGLAGPRGETRLDIRLSAAVDLYHYVRSQAEMEEPTASEEYRGAIEAARRLDERLKGIFLGWGLVERMLADCEIAEDVRERFGEIPETLTLRGGTKLKIRDEALALADELVAVEGHFLQFVWPAHRSSVVHARRRVEEVLFPKQREALTYMLDSLGMRDPHQAIPVYLVHESPWPGASTYRRPEGGSICFVSVVDEPETILFETILHEATHALDVAGGKSVLEQLRRRLERAGVERRDRLFRDVPHTIVFIQAGETVRRLIDPEHVHYGEAEGYYARVPRVAEIELPIWKAHLDGELPRNQALTRIIRQLLD